MEFNVTFFPRNSKAEGNLTKQALKSCLFVFRVDTPLSFKKLIGEGHGSEMKNISEAKKLLSPALHLVVERCSLQHWQFLCSWLNRTVNDRVQGKGHQTGYARERIHFNCYGGSFHLSGIKRNQERLSNLQSWQQHWNCSWLMTSSNPIACKCNKSNLFMLCVWCILGAKAAPTKKVVALLWW